MKHLKVRIRKWDQRGKPLDGSLGTDELTKISLIKLLGNEFLARTPREELLLICQEAFVLLASKGNDAAAENALEAAHCLAVTTTDESPSSLKISVDAFRQKERDEQKEFFDWLLSVYWGFPLLVPDSWENRTSGESGFCMGTVLPKTKRSILSFASSFWDARDDELGLTAFGFLLDNFDRHRFRGKAKDLVEKIQSARAHYGSGGFFELPKEDVELVLSLIRTAMSFKKLDVITTWIGRKPMPREVELIFKHAYVNAGGEIPSVAA